MAQTAHFCEDDRFSASYAGEMLTGKVQVTTTDRNGDRGRGAPHIYLINPYPR
jgi:hypothetical protein